MGSLDHLLTSDNFLHLSLCEFLRVPVLPELKKYFHSILPQFLYSQLKISKGHSQTERKKRKHLHSSLCLVVFVILGSKHIHRLTHISSYCRLTRGDKNNFCKQGLEKVGEILRAITMKHPANSPDL